MSDFTGNGDIEVTINVKGLDEASLAFQSFGQEIADSITQNIGGAFGAVSDSIDTLTGELNALRDVVKDLSDKTSVYNDSLNLVMQSGSEAAQAISGINTEAGTNNNLISAAIDKNLQLTDQQKTLTNSIISTTASVIGQIGSLQQLQSTFLALTATPVGLFGLAIGSVVTAVVTLNAVNDYLHAKRLAEIDAISKQTANILALEKQYNALTTQENLTDAQQESLKKTAEALKLKYNEMGISVDTAAAKMGKLGDEIIKQKISDLKDKIKELNTQIEDNKKVTEFSQAANKSCFTEYEVYATSTKILNDESKSLNDTLIASETEIKQLESQLKEKNNPATDDAAAKAKALEQAKKAEIGATQEQILKYEAMLSATDNTSLKTAELLSKIQALKTKLEDLAPSTDALTSSTVKLKDATIPYGSQLNTILGMWFDVHGYQEMMNETQKKITLTTEDATLAVTGYKDSTEAMAAVEKILEDPRQNK